MEEKEEEGIRRWVGMVGEEQERWEFDNTEEIGKVR